MRLFVNRLTTMDFSYLDADRGLLGESWYVDVLADGQPDEQGMIVDFAEVKYLAKDTIDQHFDHKLLIPGSYSGLEFKQGDTSDSIRFALKDGSAIIHTAPREAIQLIDAETVTPDTVGRAIGAALKNRLAGNVESIEVHLYPEQVDEAWYHYSHGLKQHCGNCQRIAHGHRSKILIYRNGEPDPALSRQWAEKLRDSYIATEEDLRQEYQQDGTTYFKFAYAAEQGQFELILPASRCHLIEDETTVEHIARHIAGVLATEYPEDRIQVRAYEGINKGAICDSSAQGEHA